MFTKIFLYTKIVFLVLIVKFFLFKKNNICLVFFKQKENLTEKKSILKKY